MVCESSDALFSELQMLSLFPEEEEHETYTSSCNFQTRNSKRTSQNLLFPTQRFRVGGKKGSVVHWRIL